MSARTSWPRRPNLRKLLSNQTLTAQHGVQNKIYAAPFLLQHWVQQKERQTRRYTHTRAGGMLAQTWAARVTVKPVGAGTGALVP